MQFGDLNIPSNFSIYYNSMASDLTEPGIEFDRT
jgi:hypothetical protein